jgi:hypothetical protein
MANKRILLRVTGIGRGGGLEFVLSLGSLSKVVEVLSKFVVYLEVPVPVCDMCQEGFVVLVNGEGEW